MKITIDDARKMDLVLSHLLKDEQARFKSKQVQDLLKLSFEEAHRIYESILSYNLKVEPVVSILYADNIASAPGITEAFLKSGGFEAVSAHQLNEKLEKNIKKIKETHESKWILWQRKTYWFTFGLAILAFAMALISLLFSMGVI